MVKNIENYISTALSKYPFIKKVVKRVYQRSLYLLSPKIKYEGEIISVTPSDGYEYFFGYYDKSPWDASDRYMLCLRVKDTTKSVAPNDPAEIILIDTFNNNEIKVIGTTRTWNVQQGCMLQWLGPDFTENIIFNDFRDGNYCSVIINIKSGEEKVLSMPVYSVSMNGKFALTLDFSRLHRLRKGYGYSNLPDITANEKIPDKPCIWKIDIDTNESTPILKYTDLVNFETSNNMIGAEHKVNHIMLNPSGNRFLVLHRWIKNNKKYTRLIVANIDGNDLFNLSDDKMVSHCYWKSNIEILAFAYKKNIGYGYFLMKDKSTEFQHLWPELITDGHPSYSPDGSMVVTDTYPDRSRLSSIYLIKENNIKRIARVFVPFKYDNEVRCDLHPRWNRAGNKICFDAVFEGKRGLYTISLDSYGGKNEIFNYNTSL